MSEDTIEGLRARLSALTAERDRLRAALSAAEKFVPTYSDWMDAWGDDKQLSFYRDDPTFGDLRRARAALSEASR